MFLCGHIRAFFKCSSAWILFWLRFGMRTIWTFRIEADLTVGALARRERAVR